MKFDRRKGGCTERKKLIEKWCKYNWIVWRTNNCYKATILISWSVRYHSKAWQTCTEKQLRESWMHLKKMVSIWTDGAPAITGRHMRPAPSRLIWYPCMIHQTVLSTSYLDVERLVNCLGVNCPKFVTHSPKKRWVKKSHTSILDYFACIIGLLSKPQRRKLFEFIFYVISFCISYLPLFKILL